MTRVPRLRLLAPAASVLAFVAVALAADGDLLRGRGFPRRLEEPQRAEVVATLRAFQRYWADLYATGGAPDLLNEFPGSPEVRHQLFRDLGFLGDSALVLVQDLATFDPRSVEWTGPQTAEAVVAEEWNFAYQRLPSREPLSRVKGMGTGVRYTLERRPDGRWWVTDWRSEPSAAPTPSREFTW